MESTVTLAVLRFDTDALGRAIARAEFRVEPDDARDFTVDVTVAATGDVRLTVEAAWRAFHVLSAGLARETEPWAKAA